MNQHDVWLVLHVILREGGREVGDGNEGETVSGEAAILQV